MGSLARFWRARARLRPEVRAGAEGTTIVLNLPRDQLPSGQTLVVEVAPGAAAPAVVDNQGQPVPVRRRTAGDRVFLLLP